MSAPINRDVSALCGYALVQRVAQSYLGPLWVAVDQREERDKGAHALVRHLQLPESAPAEARQAIVQAAVEARALRHENILSLLEVLEEGGELGVVYEHVAAEPLRSLQSWGNMRGLPFPIGVSLRIMIDLLAALESLHRTHSSAARLPSFGGLSPDSVLVSRTGETLLCDALVARCAASLEGIGDNPAKLGFSAPEQVRPQSELTLQSDLFAVGAMLWELVSSRRMFIGSREVIARKLLAHELPKLSDALRGGQAAAPALIASVESALAGDPRQRPATAHALAKQLEACGHPVASRHEVAEFVEKLSGQRLERRTASLQARAAAPRPAPISRPESSEIIIGVREPEAAPAVAAPAELEAPLEAEAEPTQVDVDAAFDAVLAPEPAAPAPAPAAPAAAPAVPAPVRVVRQDAARTMMGIGLPASMLASAEQLRRDAEQARPALAQLPPERAAAPASAADVPAPSSEQHGFSLPPAPPEPRSELKSPCAPRGRGRADGPARAAGRKLVLAVLGVAFAIGGVALGAVLRSSPNEPEASAVLPSVEEVGSPSAAAARPAVELPPPAAMPELAKAHDDRSHADSAQASESAPAEPAAEAEPAAPSKDFFVAKLDDAQLAEWFALEQQRDLPECSERLGKRNAGKYTGKQTQLARARLTKAKQALKSGKHDAALTELCAATAHDHGNVEAHRSLAELALNLGDAALAKAVAERGLAAAKKNKKKDNELLVTFGDALALLGDMPASRKAWLETDTKGSEPQRRRRLTGVFQKAADRALASGKLSLARIQLRRVLVLTQGSYAPSVGFAQALLSLEQPRAALAWAERAARALPKNVRAQILVGDAHAASGDSEKARAAWRAALRIQPKNAIASARLRRSRA